MPRRRRTWLVLLIGAVVTVAVVLTPVVFDFSGQ
jgi:hypothetical protein